MPSRVVATALETAVNGVLRLDPVSRDRLETLAGRQIALESAGFGLRLYLFPGAGGVRIRGEPVGTPDLTVRATPLTLLRLARGEPVSDGSLEFDGDVQLGRELQNLLAGLDIDWEELLARLIGDLPAHRLGNLARSGRAWSDRALANLTRDAGEYLQYEHRDLPPAHVVDRFLDEVDRLREDTERLEARVRRLQQRLRTR